MVLRENGDVSFQAKLKESMSKTLFKNSSNPLINEQNLLIPEQYLTFYITSAHLGVIQQWLNSGPQEMDYILSTMTVNGPYFAAGIIK